MSLIHVLDESTINQIAAGEVVERPSAVVKELTENAMDAGATAITVEIKDGGLSFIRITDNGAGISKEDIPVAFLRHATSKIRTAEDLLSITSLGFRGEALSSIAAVSQVELITKTPSALNGFRYLIEGGEEKSFEEIGCPGGTTILVRNIFFNTPARRKFLKSAVTEAGYISDLMERLMVSHPNVSFKFIMNNQVKLQSSGNNSSKDILYHVYGRDISKELLPVDFTTEDMKVTGFIGKPIITRGNRNFENYFINGRYIKSNVITKAIEEAYKPFLMQHKYPFTSLYFEIDPASIDVNVHPQKLEIRLKNSEEVYQLAYQVIRNALAGKEMIPQVTLTKQEEQKVETVRMPEPFEENRRKQMEQPRATSDDKNIGKVPTVEQNRSQLVYPYNVREQSINKVAEVNAEFKVGNESSSDGANLLRNVGGNINSLNNTLSSTGMKLNSNSVINDIGSSESNLDGIMRNNTNNVLDIALGDTANNTVNIDLSDTANNTANINLKNTTSNDSNNDSNIVKNIDSNIDSNNGSNSAANNATRNVPTHVSIPDNTSQKDTDASTNLELDKQQITASEQMNLFSDKEENAEAPFLSKKALEEHRIIGQVFATYWLVEYKKELYIIDQHAAHEKVLYERIMAASKNKSHLSQQLLPPIVLTLTLREQDILRKQEEVLKSLGYEIEHFGGKEYSVRAVPADLYSISEKDLLLEFIDDLADEVAGNASNSNSILEKVASLSCKAAVKANHSFSYEEASALIKELLTLENPYHCPHGRPVIVSMSQYELERKFKRIL